MEKNFGEAVLEIKVLPVPVTGKTINCADFVQVNRYEKNCYEISTSF